MATMPRRQTNPWPARLRKLFDASGRTQPKFATEVLGVSVRTFHAWLYGERIPEGPAAQLILCLLKTAK
jgi:DNA-binding transcriptional regulator YiaG